MNYTDVLRKDEKVVFGLRELYTGYGYSQYKMNKFEEYDLYVRNKDFLVSENVITFTDTNGKLMALKPDVTLSIIKNGEDRPEYLQKVYYHENVYRVSGSTRAFREIMQVGLECVGAVDTYAIYEVLSLAVKSLAFISEDCVLDVSHLGVVSAAIDELGVSAKAKAELLKCVGEKNAHGIKAICEEAGVDGAFIADLVSTYGTPATVIPTLEKMQSEHPVIAAIGEFLDICRTLENSEYADKIHVDFSVINDMSYYNGVVFKGFINGVPTGILSGGQYDKLMKKLKKRSKAIGFAVYLDMLEELMYEESEYDIDVLLIYDDKTDIKLMNEVLTELRTKGVSASAQRTVPEKLRYKQLLKIENGEVKCLENNA